MPSFRNKWLLLTTAGLALVTAFNARADLSAVLPGMGDLERWAVFSLGPGVVSLNDYADVQGDVGVAGSGNISLSGNSIIYGDLYYKATGTLTLGRSTKITGVKHHDSFSDAQLTNGVSEATLTSDHAFAMPVTPAYASLTNIQLSRNQNLTIRGAPFQTVVLRLQNFTISSGTLTLQGSATTNFVINVSKQFSLTNNAQIILSGGVTWDNVLFNIRGSGTNVTLGGDSLFQGILMANNRTVVISGESTVAGAVIANRIALSGGSQIIHPPVTSP